MGYICDTIWRRRTFGICSNTFNFSGNTPTGYYRIYVLYDYHAYQLRKYNGSTLISSIPCVAPIEDPYLAVARKATSSGTYVRYAY